MKSVAHVIAEATTVTQCRLTLIDGHPHEDVAGPGLMLTGRMVDPRDGRYFEVFVDDEALLVLHEALDKRIMRR